MLIHVDPCDCFLLLVMNVINRWLIRSLVVLLIQSQILKLPTPNPPHQFWGWSYKCVYIYIYMRCLETLFKHHPYARWNITKTSTAISTQVKLSVANSVFLQDNAPVYNDHFIATYLNNTHMEHMEMHRSFQIGGGVWAPGPVPLPENKRGVSSTSFA